MKIELKHISEKIDVKDDEGRLHQILVYRPAIEIPPDRQNGYRDLRLVQTIKLELSDKRPVNRIDDDTFQIVTTGEILKRVR
jgi:hypothetical protein